MERHPMFVKVIKRVEILNFIFNRRKRKIKEYNLQSKNQKSLQINSPWGGLKLIKNYFWEGENDKIEVTIENDIADLDHPDIIKKIQHYIHQIEAKVFIICEELISEIPSSDYYNLAEAYYYKNKSPFILQDFINSFVIKELALKLNPENYDLQEFSLAFFSDEKFSFGALFRMEGIKTNPSFTQFTKGNNYDNYLDFEYDYKACINVLSSNNQPEFSRFCISNLAFMEGVIHQGSLYSTSTNATELLFSTVIKCNKSVQGFVLDTLCSIKEAAKFHIKSKIDNQEKYYAEQILSFFKNHTPQIKSWNLEHEYPEHIEFLYS